MRPSLRFGCCTPTCSACTLLTPLETSSFSYKGPTPLIACSPVLLLLPPPPPPLPRRTVVRPLPLPLVPQPPPLLLVAAGPLAAFKGLAAAVAAASLGAAAALLLPLALLSSAPAAAAATDSRTRPACAFAAGRPEARGAGWAAAWLPYRRRAGKRPVPPRRAGQVLASMAGCESASAAAV